jgi:putative oxidoreductase
MLLFTFYILYMLLFEKHLPCSCGGVLKEMTWKQHLVFNLFFTAIAFTGLKILPGAHGKRYLNF